jgi:LuxR family maltose regulon positive regulatory protein
LEHPVVSIVAGPGYGKSIALSKYLLNASIQTTWVQLSADDVMPSHFWETFTQALAANSPSLASTVLAMGFPNTIDLRNYLVGLLRTELKPRLAYALVFDDLHLLEKGPVLDFIAQLVAINAQVPIVVISRCDRLPNAAELARSHRLARIEEQELAFTKSEVAEYFELLGVKASNELTSDIFRETEGWPLAISIAGRLLESQPLNSAAIRTALRGTINVIIENELFSTISTKMQHLLVQLSLVTHLPPELIDQFPGGRQMMDELTNTSSLVRYDNYMHVYRLHHLLLHYLEGKQNLLSDEERMEAYGRAARWCDANGYRIDALSYYHATANYDAIIDIAYAYPPIMPFDIAFKLFEIFENAPPEVFERYAAAYALYTRLIMMVGHVDEALAKTRERIALLEKRPHDGVTSRMLMGLYNNLGFAKLVICPETHDFCFAEDFEKALEYHQTATDPPAGGYQVYGVGPYALRLGRNKAGDPEKYIEMLERSVLCAMVTLRGCGCGLPELARSEYAFYRGLASEAERHAFCCLNQAHEQGQFEIEGRALFLLIRIYLQKGKHRQITKALSRLETLTGEAGFMNRYLLFELASSWLFAMIGEFDHVESWLRSPLWSTTANTLFDGLDDLVRLRYYLATKDYQTLLDFANSRTARHGVSRYLIGRIGLMLTQAICHNQLDNRTAALDRLREAYDLAQPNSLDMPFIEMGNAMRTLAGVALQNKAAGIPAAWLESIRSRATTYAKRVAHVRSCYLEAHNLMADVHLTNKELEILGDLSQGLSRMEISLAHGISINTVKSMLPLIYQKLGAENALDAIRIATTRGLL